MPSRRTATHAQGVTMFFRVALFIITVGALVACGESLPVDSGTVDNPECGTFLMQPTQAAQRAIGERKTATLQAATMSAGATAAADERSTTGTSQALQVRRQEMDLNATANALGVEQIQTRQAATETSEARRAETTATAGAQATMSAATAEMQALNLAASRTVSAMDATNTTYAATATRSAQDIVASAARDQATATAEALNRQRDRDQANDVRWTEWWTFLSALLQAGLAIGGLVLLFVLTIALVRYLDTLTLRQKLIETRAGTVLLTNLGNGRYAAQLVQSQTLELSEGAAFEPSQAPRVEAEAREVFKLTTAHGESFLAKDDPEAERADRQRKLAMRLLRESLKHYTAQGLDARTATRVPTYKDLNWSSETWMRAVSVLKPYVIAKQGRGGGTYCAAEYPTVMQLYAAVGERRLTLNLQSPGTAAPSPIADEVAA